MSDDETRIADLENEIKHRDRRILELKRDVDEAQMLVAEMREQGASARPALGSVFMMSKVEVVVRRVAASESTDQCERRGARFSPSPDLGRRTSGEARLPAPRRRWAPRAGLPQRTAPGLCLSSRLFRRPLHDLDARPPRVSDIGDDHAGGFILPRRLVELDPLRFDLAHAAGVVLHVYATPFEHATLGSC